MYAERLFEITLFRRTFGPNLYGIMIAIGLIMCFVFLAILGKRIGMSKKSLDFYEINGLVSIVLGFLFATIFQYVYDLIKNGSANFGSMTFLGGLIGGVATFTVVTIFFAKPEIKKDIYRVVEVAMPCVLIAHAFGRIGCFFAGCCYGIHTDGPLGMEFPYGGSHGHVLPTQLFEAIFLFIVCAVTILFINKKLAYNIPLYLLSYSIFRFTVEFFRGDERGGIAGSAVSPSQFWCIFMFIGGAALLTLMLLYKFKKDKEKIPKILAKFPKGLYGIYDDTISADEPKDTKKDAQENPV